MQWNKIETRHYNWAYRRSFNFEDLYFRLRCRGEVEMLSSLRENSSLDVQDHQELLRRVERPLRSTTYKNGKVFVGVYEIASILGEECSSAAQVVDTFFNGKYYVEEELLERVVEVGHEECTTGDIRWNRRTDPIPIAAMVLLKEGVVCKGDATLVELLERHAAKWDSRLRDALRASRKAVGQAKNEQDES
ncbi:hypothetical protein ON010_g867 [Phytophthora cinnamomi]|nr:hypothetical protein ON010_g867 [Phytophthora cinnamomi]